MHWRDLTNAYSSAMKCVVMACNNFDMAARAIEKQYILDLLSIKRYNNAVANGNNTVIRNIVNGMYDAINQVVTPPTHNILIRQNQGENQIAICS